MKEIRIAPAFIAPITSSAGGCTARTTSASRDQRGAIVDEGDILERSVGQLIGIPGAGLHVQSGAELDQLRHDGRHQGHAPLVRLGLLQDGDIDIHGGSNRLTGVLDRMASA